ncbi:hypothetical protein ACRRTK_006600 [Alexandromys fortis]
MPGCLAVVFQCCVNFILYFFEDHNKVLKKKKFSSLYVYLLLKKIFSGIDY